MFAENLLRTENADLNLTVLIKSANLDFPQSEDEVYHELLSHALHCRECLAAVLFEDVSLAQRGCDVYRRMLSEMSSELTVQESLNSDSHLTDAFLEEYSFNRLGKEQIEQMEKHTLACAPCAERLRERRSFLSCVKAAVQEHTRSAKQARVSGVIAVTAPKAEFNVCSRLRS